MKDIQPGTRVRLKVRTIFGWRGTGTMLAWERAIKDGETDPLYGCVDACTHEWAILRDQTPNPEHAAVLLDYAGRGLHS